MSLKNSEKKIPLPCTKDEHRIIKMFCLVNGIKYEDLTKLVLEKVIKVNDNKL